ncbi:organic cation transporter protein [Elysia marginata]|uniref:Organic cation transporter protein n=1 Tax=Elysia marginata TaxID=1093978 RepID=A0AAV4GWE7_9GAST|nr:organic cation transporter protein [Elysia marginata]
MELVGPNWRKFAGNAVNVFWSTGLFIEAGLAYMLRDWVYLQIAISVPLLPVFFCYVAFIQESPRWLLQQGRLDEASKVLENVAKKNGVVVPEKVKNLQDVVQEKAEKNLWHLFTSTTLLIRSFIIFLNWMVASMIFYGLSLNSGDLSGNVYVNFVLMATAELVSFLFALFVMDITGRKKLHCSSMIVGGVACLATMFPVMYGRNDINWLTIALSLVGKFGSTVGFAVIYVYTAELFPTVLRNSIIGICSVCARIGGILAPFIGDMGKQVGGKLEIALPLVIFGGASVVAGLLVLFLPETSHTVLPETIEDAKRFGRPQRVLNHHQTQSGNRNAKDFNQDDPEALLVERRV